MNDIDHIETLYMKQRREQFRRECALDWWRTVAVVAIVTAGCGWLTAAILLWMTN